MAKHIKKVNSLTFEFLENGAYKVKLNGEIQTEPVSIPFEESRKVARALTRQAMMIWNELDTMYNDTKKD